MLDEENLLSSQDSLVSRSERQRDLRQRDINVISLFFSLMFLGLIICYPAAKMLSGDRPLSNVEKNYPPCNYSINEQAKGNFTQTVRDKEVKLLYVNISLPLNQCSECGAIMPMHWAWVSDRDSEVSTFISWQEDYVIWSLSILDFYVVDNIKMPMNVSSNCSDRWGEHKTMKHIAESLQDMVLKDLSHLKQDYNDSMWCYRSKLDVFYPFQDQFVRNFQFFEQDMATYCFRYKDNAKHYIEPTMMYTDIPFALTFIAILFSPLIVVYILHFLSNTSPVPWLDWGGSPSDSVPSDSSYVYLGFKSPHTFTSIVSRFLPPLPALLKQVVLLLIAPVIIYVKVVIYKIYHNYQFLLRRQIEHNLSIGFSSMLFPYNMKSKNFLTFTLGPCYFFLLYHVVGLLLIVIYKLITFKVRTEKEKETRSSSSIPLACLHLDKMVSIENNTLKYTTLNVVVENSIERACSKEFWQAVYKKDRWWQLPFSAVFHFIPFLFVNQLVLKLSLSGIAEALASKEIGRMSTFILCSLFGTLQIVFLFTFVTIFLASLEFIALILTFCYISMVTYPTESAGYFLFAVSAFFYLSRCMRDISRTYQHLLLMSVEASKELEKGFRIQHAGRDVPCPEFVHYEHSSWGIPSARFEKLVDKYEPKPSTLIKAVVKFIVVLGLLGWTLKLLFKLHGASNLSPLVNLFGAFVIVKLPDLLAILTTDFKSEKEDSLRLIHLKNTIKALVEKEEVEEEEREEEEEGEEEEDQQQTSPESGHITTPLASNSAPVQVQTTNIVVGAEISSSVSFPPGQATICGAKDIKPEQKTNIAFDTETTVRRVVKQKAKNVGSASKAGVVLETDKPI